MTTAENKAVVPSSSGEQERQSQPAAFLEIVEAIPAQSPMRDRTGMLKPHYNDARSFFDAGNLWNDAARIAQTATSAMTIHGRGEVVSVRAVKEKVIETLRAAMAQSSDHEPTFRAFAQNCDRQFEAVFGGRFGFKDSDDIHNFNIRNEIATAYLRHLKPAWLDEDALKKYGRLLILAMHLADQILRRRYARPTRQGATAFAAARHPARTVAAIRVMIDVMSNEAERSLMPDDQTVLARYLRFESKPSV